MGKFYDVLEKAKKDRFSVVEGPGTPAHAMEKGNKEADTPSSRIVQLQVSPRLDGDSENEAHACNGDAASLIAEKFKALKTLIFYAKNGTPPRTLLVTSTLPLEGKSTVAANLAISLAQGQSHALLVDCDFRRPVMHRRFGVTAGRGLADHLSDNALLPEILVKTGIPRLSLLPVGTIPDHPEDLMASEKMERLVQELSTRYSDRYVIFDSSPLHLSPETRLLMSQVDGILLVVRAGKTQRDLVSRTMQEIDVKKFLGVVLNGVERCRSNRYVYDHGY